MVRQNIFEILSSSYDIEKEIDKIENLFKIQFIQNVATYRETSYTIEEFVDAFLLFKWKQRGSYLSCNEIKTCIINSILGEYKYSEKSIITILEYYLNLINLFEINNYTNNINIRIYREYWMLKENIDILIEHLNYEKLIFDEEEELILVPKNPAATAVAEISTLKTAFAILKYNHSQLKGDLEEKRKLLYQIALEYEPLLSNPINGFKDFFEKTNNLLNNLHIRHNNTSNQNNKNTVINIDDKELEKWYDELYQLLLFCVLIKDNIDRKAEVEEFLKTIKGTKS